MYGDGRLPDAYSGNHGCPWAPFFSMGSLEFEAARSRFSHVNLLLIGSDLPPEKSLTLM